MFEVRQVHSQDFESILLLNEDAIPHVNKIGISDLKHFKEIAYKFIVVDVKREDSEHRVPVAFMIVLDKGKAYESVNYKFFDANLRSFSYIDRIVVDKDYRKLGIGKLLYDYLFSVSKHEWACCEVNIIPPNPNSMKFHKSMGFNEISKMYTNNKTKAVSLMKRKI